MLKKVNTLYAGILSKVRHMGKDLSYIVDEDNNDTNKLKNINNLKKQLPNMIFLNEKGWECNIALRVMTTMIKQENTCR